MTLRMKILLGILAVSTIFLMAQKKAESDIYVWNEKKINQIVENLCKASGECERIPKVFIQKSSTINAYAMPGIIVLYTGLLDKVKNADEAALIIAHEMAHVLLDHHAYIVRDDQLTRRLESEADKYGAFIVMKAGYDVCKARHFFLTFAKIFGDSDITDHPSNAYRYSQLNVNCGVI